MSHEQRRKEAAIEALQEGFVEQDATGKIISWNTSALEILHISEDQINGKTSDDPVWGAIHEDGSPFPGKDHPAMVALKTKRPVRDEIMGLVNPELSSDVRWIKINAHPYEVSGEWYVTALFSDVTQDVNLRKSLELSESRWNLALESAHQGVWDWDIRQEKLFTSDQWKRLLGYSPDEVGDSLDEWSSRIHEEDKAEAFALLQEVLDGKKNTYEAHYRMITKSGEIRYHFDRGAVVERDSEGNPIRMIGTNTDESDIVEQKLQIKKVSDYLQTLIDSLPFAAIVLDEHRAIRFQNEHVCSLLEISGGELSGITLEKFFPDPIVRNEFLQKYQSLAKGWHEFEIQRSSGETVITSWRFIRFKEDSVLILVQNVTEERSQSLLLRKMSYALDQTEDGVIMTDLEGIAVYANDSSQMMFGYDPVSDEFVGHHVSELDASPEQTPEGLFRSDEIIQELNKHHTWSGKMQQKKKNGDLLLTHVTATLMVDEQDRPIGMIGTLRDISEEEHLKQALEENRLKLAAIFENLPVGVFTIDSKGHLETQNAIIRELLSDNVPEVLTSKSLADLFGEFTIYGSGHQELQLEELPPFQAIQSGKVVHNRDIEIVNSRTNQVVFMNVVAAPLISESGENHGAVCMIEDITELKQIEDAKTEFVSMASHQLRTP